MARAKFPDHWGEQPKMQTRDIRPLPGNFGMGSSTLHGWINSKMAEDEANGLPVADGGTPGSFGAPPQRAPNPFANNNAASAMLGPNVGPWPEMIGRDGEEAIAELKVLHPNHSFALMLPGRMATADHRMDRVRVQVDEEGKVHTAPRCG